MKNILITGASGFIGSNMVNTALDKGWNVWAGIRKHSKTDHLNSDRINFIDLKYDNPEILKNQVMAFATENGKWDYIIHCAGITKSVNKRDFTKVNFEYTLNLTNTLKDLNVVPNKFIYLSSFGLNTDSEYGKSKKLTESYFENEYCYPYIILRPTGVYGPRDSDYLQMIKLLDKRIQVSVGLKPQKLSFVHVSDLVDFSFKAMESEKINLSVQISDGGVYTSDQFATLISDYLHKTPLIKVRIPLFVVWTISIISEIVAKLTKKPSLINADKYKILKVRDWTCDITRLEKDFNFVPGLNLKSGLADTIDWYKKNKWLK